METIIVMKTLIIVILDESGSMHGMKADILGGYNGFLEKQKAMIADEASLSLIKFNTQVTVVHEIEPIGSIPELTAESYSPSGGTALWDAVASGVAMAEKQAATSDRILCLIMTDGEENSSRNTSLEQVRHLITTKEAAGKWNFAYIGTNPDKWASETGTRPGNTLAFHPQVMGLVPQSREQAGVRVSRAWASADSACNKLRSGEGGQEDDLFS